MGDMWGDIVSAGQSAISNAQSFGAGAVSTVGNAISGAGQAGSNIMSGAGDIGSRVLSGVESVNNAGIKLAAAETGVIFAPAVLAAGSILSGAKMMGDVMAARAAQSEGTAGISFTKPSTLTETKTSGVSVTKNSDSKKVATANWIEPISNRPGFRKTEDLGLDQKTWSLISEGNTPLQAVTMRLKEETKPSVRRELEWQQTQLAANKVEMSSDYHNWAKSTGAPTAINPFENEGDRALALMQGMRQESKLQIAGSNPSVSGLFADLPDGQGLNDRSGYTQKSPDFTKAVDWVEAARYDPGVYGGLNSNRNYDDWNRARPEAPIKVISSDEIIYGKSQSHKVPDDLGYFGRKTEPIMPKSHIKKYDKTITETLFGSREVHKSGRRKEVRGLKGTEWDMLGELGVYRPTSKKSQTALRDDIHYTRSNSSFQSMQKPNASVRKSVVDEIDILMGTHMTKSKKSTKTPKKSASKRKGRKGKVN